MSNVETPSLSKVRQSHSQICCPAVLQSISQPLSHPWLFSNLNLVLIRHSLSRSSCIKHSLSGRLRARVQFSVTHLLFRMPGSQWSSRGSSRAGSAPSSGEVTRVSSASSAVQVPSAEIVQVSSTEVSRTSSSSSLGRIMRSRSGSSTGSIPFPRYSPLDVVRRTPNGYCAHIVLLPALTLP